MPVVVIPRICLVRFKRLALSTLVLRYHSAAGTHVYRRLLNPRSMSSAIFLMSHYLYNIITVRKTVTRRRSGVLCSQYTGARQDSVYERLRPDRADRPFVIISMALRIKAEFRSYAFRYSP